MSVVLELSALLTDQCRFVSERALPSEIWHDLLRYYSGLTHLQCVLGVNNSWNSQPRKHAIHIRSLELQFETPLALKDAVSHVCKHMRASLDTLRLSVLKPYEYHNRRLHSEALSSVVREVFSKMKPAQPNQSTSPMLYNLKELTLQSFDISSLYGTVMVLSGLRNILRLTLSSCHGTVDFLSNIEKHIGGGSLRLTHFGLQSDDEELEWSDDVLAAAGSCLRNLLASSKLESVHLSWADESPLWNVLPGTPVKAPNLMTLGIHDESHASIGESANSAGRLRNILTDCHQLQALGWQISNLDIMHSQNEEQVMNEAFMVSAEFTTM